MKVAMASRLKGRRLTLKLPSLPGSEGGVLRGDAPTGEHRGAADGVEEVGGEREVEHFLHQHAPDEPGDLDVAAVGDRVEGAEVRREGGEFQFECDLEVSLEGGEVFDAAGAGVELEELLGDHVRQRRG
jgi:hypothetical protein